MVESLRNAPSNVLPIYRLRVQLKLVGKGAITTRGGG